MPGSIHPALLSLFSALAYGALFGLNQWLFGAFSFSEGVAWVFLPSGLRLLLVVVCAGAGAVGIAIASSVISVLWFFQEDPLTGVVAGLISGLAPWLARRISFALLGVREDLAGLRAGALLRMAALFALVSATLHQVWYVARGHSPDFVQGTLVMSVGDFLGALIVLYVARLALMAFSRLARC
ncbi:MAG: hypothetical protein RIS35_1980 [Pseudomonadota bacterium]